MGYKITASRRTKILIFAVAVIVCIGIFVSFWLTRQNQPTTDITPKAPTYPTVLPKSKSIESLGGWKTIHPPKNQPVYIYNDKIDSVEISVSQQPLPKEFRGNIDNKVAEIAKKFNATTAVDVGNTKMYIGTSAKGPQSVIVATSNLLILIKSKQKISNDSWVAYLKTLE